MIKQGFIILLVLAWSVCNSPEKESDELVQNDPKGSSHNSERDTMPKITGIGGIFFYSDNPAETTAWYKKNLGLETDDYGSVFEFRNANRPDEINYLRWSAFSKETDHFNPSTRDFMINYRVQNIEAMVAQFEANGVTVLDSIATYPYGKFVHIMDPEGNKIELWEPVDSELTKMGGNTTK